MTPRERWLQRILHARGVRPVGHADPVEDQADPAAPVAPVIPVQPQTPAPGWPPAGTRTARISTTSAAGTLPPPGRTMPPDWVVAAFEEDDRKEAEARAAGEAAATAAQADVEDDEPGVEPAVDEDQDEAVDDATPPAPSGPVVKVPPGAKPVKSTAPRSRRLSTDDPSLRITVFNLSAAAVGCMTPLAGVIDTYLVAAEQCARGVFAAVLALAAGYGAWRLTGHQAVKPILPHPFLARPLITVGAAEIARRWAPVPVEWLNRHGAQWGLGPDAVSLLITSGVICGAAWWGIDRNLRRFHWVVRWFFRIPLATAAVVALNYGNPL